MKNKKVRPPFFERIKSGLEEIILHCEGKIQLKTYAITVPDAPPEFDKSKIVALRDRLKLSQPLVASLINVPVSTVQQWESGRRKPTGAAARLLQVYAERPDVVEFITHAGNGKPAKAKSPARAGK